MRTYYPSAKSIPILIPEAHESCAELDAALESFYDDPITEAYGAQDCGELIIQSHVRRCVTCRRLTVMA